MEVSQKTACTQYIEVFLSWNHWKLHLEAHYLFFYQLPSPSLFFMYKPSIFYKRENLGMKWCCKNKKGKVGQTSIQDQYSGPRRQSTKNPSKNSWLQVAKLWSWQALSGFSNQLCLIKRPVIELWAVIFHMELGSVASQLRPFCIKLFRGVFIRPYFKFKNLLHSRPTWLV